MFIYLLHKNVYANNKMYCTLQSIDSYMVQNYGTELCGDTEMTCSAHLKVNYKNLVISLTIYYSSLKIKQ